MSESVEIPDAAVEAGVEAWATAGSIASVQIRAALVAARPYLMPEVVVDHRPGETCSVAAEVDPGTGFARPLLDRDKVSQVLVSFALGGREGAASPHELLGMAVHAIEGLARPMPTREAIAEAMHNHWSDTHLWRQGCREDLCISIFLDRAAVVVALLNGEIEKGEDRWPT